MKKSRRSGRGTKADDNQKLSSGITRGNLGHRANKIARGAIASTGVRGDSAAPTSNPRTLQMQPTAVVSMDTDRANGNISHGEISDPDAVTKYADAISSNWQRGVEAFLEIARLCADAEEQLDRARQVELKAKLPFGAATFSKFRQIGLDARLRKPEVQVLLPAAYTTIYAIACLKNDKDLSAAIAEKIIKPDMKRCELEKWWKEREAARQAKADAPGDALAFPANPVSDAVDNNNATGNATESDGPGEAPVPTVEAPQPLASSEAMPGDTDNSTSASPSVAPQGDENVPSGVAHCAFSDGDQREFDALMTAWKAARPVVQERFVSEVLGLDPSSIGRPPTGGES
jgi:hypothetical protein